MIKKSCPYCGGVGISAIRKLFLGPGIPARCRKCGNKFSVSYRLSLLIFIAFFMVYIGVTNIDIPILRNIVIFVCLVMVAVIQLMLPTEKR